MWLCTLGTYYGMGKTPEEAFEDLMADNAPLRTEPEDCEFWSGLQGPKSVASVKKTFTIKERQ